MIKLFLFDIEGTTTDIKFVHKVLFPYSFENLEHYIELHKELPAVQKAFDSVRMTVKEEEGRDLDNHGITEKLKEWIKSDRKHGALKEIQGMIWDVGYSKNDFKGHVYPDVKPFFTDILTNGYKVGIYSSGSVHAQKLIFGYSEAGDLTPFISYYFDTKIGPKREESSYAKIAQEVQLKPNEIHFFSDIPEELRAAWKAGLRVTQVLREGTLKSEFESIHSFEELLDSI
jgi:enolase-phosphatase E1